MEYNTSQMNGRFKSNKWFKLFLDDRKYYYTISNIRSSDKTVIGVSQGSVERAIFYSLY